jgi:streptomycin 6-kinase
LSPAAEDESRGKVDLELPDALSWWRDAPDGAAWLDRLPRLAEECAQQWELELGPPFTGGNVSLVLPAGDAVLKLNFPDEESEHEADALALWGGDGTVRLLAHDPGRRALLIERCRPGTTLWEVEDERAATRIAAALLLRIWRPPPPDHPFRLLATEAARWAAELPGQWERLGRPFDRSLLDEAVATARDLSASQQDLVVVHQDFHGGNVLRAQREPWLVIDPKPLVGERAFDAASLLRDRPDELARDPAPARRVGNRVDQLTDELGVDRERLRGWGVVHALAWGVSESKLEHDMVACAEWLARA